MKGYSDDVIVGANFSKINCCFEYWLSYSVSPLYLFVNLIRESIKRRFRIGRTVNNMYEDYVEKEEK